MATSYYSECRECSLRAESRARWQAERDAEAHEKTTGHAVDVTRYHNGYRMPTLAELDRDQSRGKA